MTAELLTMKCSTRPARERAVERNSPPRHASAAVTEISAPSGYPGVGNLPASVRYPSCLCAICVKPDTNQSRLSPFVFPSRRSATAAPALMNSWQMRLKLPGGAYQATRRRAPAGEATLSLTLGGGWVSALLFLFTRSARRSDPPRGAAPHTYPLSSIQYTPHLAPLRSQSQPQAWGRRRGWARLAWRGRPDASR